MEKDTIIAISTPMGHGGLGVIRLSGKKSLLIAKKFFLPFKKKIKIPPRQPLLGNLVDIQTKEKFDTALITYFPAPHTYTKEDIVEISCHGSPVILEEVIRIGIKAGARLASPGEFTRRAYLNGRIDIIQAEAINDIIQAPSLRQAKISFHQLEGSLSKKMETLRQQIINLTAQLEADIEFPEEEINLSKKHAQKILEQTIERVTKLIHSYDLGKTLSEGISLAIAGKTNVGKSTLFNALLETERAIVTPYPGTTRDYLREEFKINDSIFSLIDMAGLTKTTDPAEKEGVKRGKKITENVDGILLLFDTSKLEEQEDSNLANKLKEKKVILIFNKNDLPTKMNVDNIKKSFPNSPYLYISALKKKNLDRLRELIYSTYVPEWQENGEILLHLRQKLILESILHSLHQGLILLQEGYSEEIYAEEIRIVIKLIGDLTGEVHSDEILDNIFCRFCIGK